MCERLDEPSVHQHAANRTSVNPQSWGETAEEWKRFVAFNETLSCRSCCDPTVLQLPLFQSPHCYYFPKLTGLKRVLMGCYRRGVQPQEQHLKHLATHADESNSKKIEKYMHRVIVLYALNEFTCLFHWKWETGHYKSWKHRFRCLNPILSQAAPVSKLFCLRSERDEWTWLIYLHLLQELLTESLDFISIHPSSVYHQLFQVGGIQ